MVPVTKLLVLAAPNPSEIGARAEDGREATICQWKAEKHGAIVADVLGATEAWKKALGGAVTKAEPLVKDAPAGMAWTFKADSVEELEGKGSFTQRGRGA